MTQTTETLPLVLGGHSFISQLGNEPMMTIGEQIALVATCLDAGIRQFDTTYQPERLVKTPEGLKSIVSEPLWHFQEER